MKSNRKAILGICISLTLIFTVFTMAAEATNFEVNMQNELAEEAVSATFDPDGMIRVNNNSAEPIWGFKISVSVGEKTIVKSYNKNLNGFEEVKFSLYEFFSEEFVQGKNVKILIEDEATWCESIIGSCIGGIASFAIAWILFLRKKG